MSNDLCDPRTSIAFLRIFMLIFRNVSLFVYNLKDVLLHGWFSGGMSLTFSVRKHDGFHILLWWCFWFDLCFGIRYFEIFFVSLKCWSLPLVRDGVSIIEAYFVGRARGFQLFDFWNLVQQWPGPGCTKLGNMVEKIAFSFLFQICPWDMNKIRISLKNGIRICNLEYIFWRFATLSMMMKFVNGSYYIAPYLHSPIYQ